MTTFRTKGLADGELPNAQGVIFTAVADVGTYVKSFTLYNKNAITQDAQVWLKRANGSGTERLIGRYEMAQDEYASVIDEDLQSLELEPGDTILAQTNTANAVDFDIGGVTEVN